MNKQIFQEIGTYYVFAMGSEFYALNIDLIKEIKTGCLEENGLDADTPPYIRGTIEFENEEIQVVDFGLLLHTKQRQSKVLSKMVVVVEPVSNNGRKQFGLMVDY